MLGKTASRLKKNLTSITWNCSCITLIWIKCRKPSTAKLIPLRQDDGVTFGRGQLRESCWSARWGICWAHGYLKSSKQLISLDVFPKCSDPFLTKRFALRCPLPVLSRPPFLPPLQQFPTCVSLYVQVHGTGRVPLAQERHLRGRIILERLNSGITFLCEINIGQQSGSRQRLKQTSTI